MPSIQTQEDHYNPHIPVEDRVVELPGWKGSEASHWMSTVQKKTSVSEHIYSLQLQEIIDMNPPLDFLAFRGNVGDWWGDVKSHEEVPGPYDTSTFYRFGPDELSSLPGDWRFLYLIRDGRNQIESMMNIVGGVEEQKSKQNKDDYFLVLCKGWRNRARLALDCQKRLQNFRLFHFENLITEPMKTMKAVYSFLDLELDKDKVQKAWDFSVSQVRKSHSSFCDNTKTNNRYSFWTDWQKEQFNNIAGKELIELGYKKGYDW